MSTQLWVAGYDLHWPKVHKPTFNAMLAFMQQNKVSGYIFGGDQFDNAEISHHNKGKHIFKERASYKRNTDTFKAQVLEPLDKLIGRGKKVWITGNHERFEIDLIEHQPELEGMLDHIELLRLRERGWEIVELGHAYKLGKLAIIHGEVLTGLGSYMSQFPAKKAVELYAGNVLAGHTHAPQSYTRVSPVGDHDRWMAWISPVLGNTNPEYLRNRPTAWINGFTVIEVRSDGRFNLYPVYVHKGEFAYGGRIYKAAS
jgi:predicted phosphodiesterase